MDFMNGDLAICPHCGPPGTGRLCAGSTPPQAARRARGFSIDCDLASPGPNSASEETVPDIVTSEAELEAIYGLPSGPAVIKEIDHISDNYRRFIELSPFVVLATSGPEGLDCTPRGDPPGFVRVVDTHTVMLPDRRGSNRIASLRNIVRGSRVALLFLIPGAGRTLRINGRAAINTNPELCASFTMEGKLPRSVSV